MWKTPLTTSSPLDIEGVGSERTELGPYGDRVYHYRRFEDLTDSGEMLEDIGVSVVSQPKNGFGWVQYRGYCSFAKENPWGESDSDKTMTPPGLGLVDNHLTIAIPGDVLSGPQPKSLFDILDYEKTNEAVEKAFRVKWQVNAKRNANNYPNIHSELGLKEYVDTLHNKTVVLIGAGPSLEKNAKLLQTTGFISVAMLHALPYLTKIGYKPRFSVHTDALPDDRVFIPDDTSGITLIANVIVAASVIRKWKAGGGKVRFYGGISQTSLTQKVSKIAPADCMVIPMGCSMGSALYIFDEIMNASNFILIGSDLSYKPGNSHTHCYDGLSENYNHKEAGIVTLPIQNPLTGQIYDTCYQFVLYKHNIENYTRRRMDTTNKRYVNATEGGILMLDETMTLTQAIEEFDYE